ncbi:branched-chain amino acid aminotransferase, putative [Ricinus communis]|uniref:Branched-chain amino acid aminotransferase, putative n=1 Tax=Ricinus communis TaxID=3988 RepID=B9S7U3_RICCO|nr:branched-chain amino acid aminotransferase, putative [Ricinus communis]
MVRWQQGPPHGKGTLYLRPLLFGSGSVLAIGPAPETTFVVYASPIGTFYEVKCMNLYIEKRVFRPSPGGTGGINSITNYGPVFEAVKQAKAEGFDDLLFLDAATGKGFYMQYFHIEGTILPGITRKSMMDIARDFGYQVQERLIPVEDVLDADEVFCTGTAMIVTPVGSITYHDKRVEYKTGQESVSHKLRTKLTGIQTGLTGDKKEWTVLID